MAEKIDVLLISPPVYRLYGSMQAAPPLGLLYISRYLNENGINAKVYNADFEGEYVSKESDLAKKYNDYLRNMSDPKFEAWGAIRQIIRKNPAKIIGITVVTPSYVSTLKVVKIIKEELPDTKVVLGGPHVTALPEETLEELGGVDVVIVGEGEQTMLELAQGKDYKDIDGICFRDKDSIVRTGQRELIQDIDALPFPMIEDMIFEKNKIHAFSELFSSRGCPFNCTYCASVTTWRRNLRLRSPKNIYDEMLFRKTKYKVTDFQFWDDALTIDKERTFAVCDYIKKLGVTWSGQTRADQVTKEIITALKESGCKEIALGVESGNQKILDMAKKSQKVEEVIRAFRIIKEAGIKTTAFFMFGLPGETEESIEDTFKLIREIKPDTVCPHIATPLPGTDFFNLAKKEGWIVDVNWENYYIVGRTDSVVKLPTIERKKIMEAYWKLQNIADKINIRESRKTFLNPFFILKKIRFSDLKNPSELWRKVKILYSMVKK